jgi:hypothetical protein
VNFELGLSNEVVDIDRALGGDNEFVGIDLSCQNEVDVLNLDPKKEKKRKEILLR